MSVADSTAGLWFSFHLEDDEFIAFIAGTALQTCFNAASTSPRDLLRAYEANLALIESVARQRFLNGAPRPIRLTVSDFAGAGQAREETTGSASPYK